MTISSLTQSVGSGDSLVGHVLTAASLGDGLSSTAVWALQTFAHVDPPAAVDQLITALAMVIASIAMRVFANWLS